MWRSERDWRSFCHFSHAHGLEVMAPTAAAAGIDAHGDAEAREQRLAPIRFVELKPHRQTLNDFDPIAGRIFRRQDREIGSGARTHTNDMCFDGAVRISVDVDIRLLPRL